MNDKPAEGASALASPVLASSVLASMEAERLEARLVQELWIGLTSLVVALIGILAGGPGWLPGFAAVVGLATGYLVHRLKQHDDALGRLRQRLEDEEALAQALLAEVVDNEQQARQAYLVTSVEAFLERMRREEGYNPFFALDPAPGLVYRALLSRITLLPSPVISAVVAYHEADAGVTQAIATFRSDEFRALSLERRLIFVRNSFDLLALTYPMPPDGPSDRSTKSARARFELQEHASLARREGLLVRDAQMRSLGAILARGGALLPWRRPG